MTDEKPDPVTIYLDPAIRRKLKVEAAYCDTTMSAIVEDSLVKHFEEQDKQKKDEK